ncbi:MAG: 6-bladed beta-propeller [Rikenellaceae bacterium]
MKKNALLVLSLLLLLSCQSQKIGEVVATEENGLIIANTKSFKDTLEIKLTDFIENIELIQLDSAIANYVSLEMSPYISDNYIIFSSPKSLLKMFDRKTGKFICNIGGVGNGNGEYRYTDDCFIDEQDKIIYLAAKGSINKYDFEGKMLGSLPLAKNEESFMTIKFDINKKANIITIIAQSKEIAMWKQDFEGNEIADIDVYKDETIGNAQIIKNSNIGNMTISVSNLENKPDTLFKFDNNENILKPAFALNINHLPELEGYNGTCYARTYIESPSYYISSIVLIRMETNQNGGIAFHMNMLDDGVIVDKETLTGGYFKLFDDYLYTKKKKLFFREDYCVIGFDDPMLLLERLESISDEEKANMSSETAKRIDTFISTLNPEGNTVIMLGKLK